MRLRTVMMPLALGLAARAFMRHQRARRAASDAGARHADSFASDPGDPVQRFDEIPELQGTPLEVDALSVDDVEAAQDLASLEAEIDEIAVSDDAAIEMVDVDVDVLVSSRDAGDLYGGDTPPALDRDPPDDDLAATEGQTWEGQTSEGQTWDGQTWEGQTWEGQTWEGQTWIEALETSAIENGTEPERELDDIVDDEDVSRPPHASRTRDTPVADHGSGGRRGL
jgi:hypothetical protein